MLNAEPYLIFNGECREAFAFYEKVFDAQIAYICQYKDLPPDQAVDEKDADRVLHALLPISKQVKLMGADTPTGMEHISGNNIWLTLNAESAEEAQCVFDRLSEGGTVECPLDKTFYATLYGMLTDRFGIGWMVSYNEPE